MSKSLRWFMLSTDIGFIIYWSIVFLNLIPPDYVYQDYQNPVLIAWNLSFIPLDFIISITGFASIYLHNQKNHMAMSLCIISLALTFCSGLQAIAFWTIRGDIDLWWWIPNIFLMVYPLCFLPGLMRKHAVS
jgi:hypothetical protein